ncbi:EamA family transporter [Meridianimarinicoccus roseus]|uniref:EamA family transporter n=1 Tax=Meridianimarinicoccus roseus TaxID=2072018 RepID=A0A2V2LES0_9RHOB|nr:DMT family transporter [Meridianimarinicoccus roseus]PWR00929.1 EamA family transporter [Meridianimarinicoccus roseus]
MTGAPWADNTRGAALMTLCMAGYALNDTCIKALADTMPLGQVLFLRGVLTSVLIGAWVGCHGLWRVHLSRRDWSRVALRTLGEVGAAYFFISALFHMPLANAVAVLQAIPLTVALAAALFLGEPLGWRRLSAILLGFVGVLLIIRPGPDGFNTYALYALMAVAAVTLRDLSTRRLDGSVPTMTVVLFASLGVTVLGAGLGGSEVWTPVTAQAATLLVASAAFITGAYVCSVMVMRVGDIGVIAPFRYTGLLWSMLLGLLAFGDFPGPVTLLGAGIVVAAGVFTFYRERALARR